MENLDDDGLSNMAATGETNDTYGNTGNTNTNQAQSNNGVEGEEEGEGEVGGGVGEDVGEEEDESDYGDVLGLTEAAILEKTFRSEERAYLFYCKFGRCHGFGVRKGDYMKDGDGKVVRRRFYCNRAGLREEKHYERLDRKRSHRAETRTNCDAKLAVFLDKEGGVWRVRNVIMKHNHELTACTIVHMIRKHRNISEAAKSHIDGLHGHGVATCKILGYMAGISGGYSLMGFLKKDGYNYVDKVRREKIADSDSNATIVYLEGKAAVDPMSMAKYNCTEDGMLSNLLWADGISRVDFQYFGDVIAFDATYRKNKYNRPLVIFSGANNHRQTTVFGFGLVLDEMIASYTWMLESLLEVMCNKAPSIVDGT